MTFWMGGLIATGIGIVALFYLKLTMNKSYGPMKEVFKFLFSAALIFISYTTLAILLAYNSIEITNNYWLSVTGLYFGAGILWTYFAYKLKKLFNEIEVRK